MFHARRILWGANLILLLALAYVAAGWFRADRGSRPAAPDAEDAAGARAIAPGPPITQGDCAMIVRRNIFGSRPEPAEATVPARREPPTAVETPLQLKLLGTVAGEPDVARAVIENTTDRSQNLFRIGDLVQGARLEAIERESVTLLRSGGRVVLHLAMSSAEAAPAPTAAASEAEPRPAVHEAVRAVGPDTFHVNKSALLARVGGIEAVLKAAQLSPYVEDGQTRGIRISGLDKISMARFVGLEDNDVIQNVNGQEFTSMTKAFQVIQKARSQPSLRVRLLRGEEEKTLSFAMQ